MSISTSAKFVSKSSSAKFFSKHWKTVREEEIWSSLEEDYVPLLEVRYHDFGYNRDAYQIIKGIIVAALKGQPVIIPTEIKEEESFFHEFDFFSFIGEINSLRTSGEIPAFLELEEDMIREVGKDMMRGSTKIKDILIPSQDEGEEVFILKDEKTFKPLGYSRGDLVLQRCVPEVLNDLNSKPMYGLELESDFGPTSRNISGYINILNYGVLANDSSTDIEFVSAPMEHEIMITILRSNRGSFDNYLQDNHRNTTGMHVHYSRTGLGIGNHLGRLLQFMNREENHAYIEDVAGRKTNRFCEFNDCPYEAHYPSDFRDPDRYQVLNTLNDKTIEFRVFKSPNNVQDVIANLEWVRDVIEFTRSNDSTYYEDFLSWREEKPN